MRRIWLLLLVLGILVRVIVWWGTIGTNDVVSWAAHAQHVSALGLAQTYREFQSYNHPPLAGFYSAWAWARAQGDITVFARLIKLPALFGAGLTLFTLWRLGGLRLAALYALLPAPILVAAYHGNTDCLYAAFVLVAALAFDRKHYALAGLVLAAALNVKLIPLVLVPLFLIAAPSWRALLYFSLALGVGLLPYLDPALHAGDAMYRNMIAYNSNADDWGLLAMLNDAERSTELHRVAAPLRDEFLWAGRYMIMGSMLLLALLSRFRLRLSLLEQVALGSSLFLLLAPGFGVQYVVFVTPALMAVSARAGVFWGLASGLFIGALYAAFLVPGPQWVSWFNGPFPGWTPELGIVAWSSLGVWTWLKLLDAWRSTKHSEPLTVAQER